MLVKCSHCGVSFDPKLGRCLSCQQPLSDDAFSADAFANVAFELWEESGSWKKAKAEIISRFGLTDARADEVLVQAKRVHRADSRDSGGKLVASGIGMIAFGIAFGVVIFGISQGRTVSGISTISCAAGAAFVIGGLIKSFTGMR